jgi:hypothetical protein
MKLTGHSSKVMNTHYTHLQVKHAQECRRRRQPTLAVYGSRFREGERLQIQRGIRSLEDAVAVNRGHVERESRELGGIGVRFGVG